MTKSVDHPNRSADLPANTQLLFVTDPLCSWCWATLPEVMKVRDALGSRVSFDLIMGGLQVGEPDGLLGYDVKRLRKLWQEVRETTGQTFSGKIPDGFIYHSELSCRAAEIARDLARGEPPFEFFYELQSAFYLQGLDINDPEILARLLAIETAEVNRALQQPEVISRTREHFDYAKSLAATALPQLLIDVGEGFQLLCGGYVTEEFLLPDIMNRLSASQT